MHAEHPTWVSGYFRFTFFARVAKLADAPGSGPGDPYTVVEVQVLSRALTA